MSHEHAPKIEVVVGFTGPVATHHLFREERADGGVTYVETCECGAQRRTNSNGRFVERGTWLSTTASELYWARRAPRLELVKRAASRGLAVVAVWRNGVGLLGRDRQVTEVTWEQLRAAAKQSDEVLSTIYASALQDAEAMRPPGIYW